MGWLGKSGVRWLVIIPIHHAIEHLQPPSALDNIELTIAGIRIRRNGECVVGEDVRWPA